MTASARRKSIRFALVFIPTFIILVWPFAFVGRGFRSLACRAVNGLIMNPPDQPDLARLVPDPAPGREWHATAAVWNQPGQFVAFNMDVDLHQVAYLPLMLFIALLVAGMVTLGRRRFPVHWQVLGVGLLLARSSLRFVLLSRQADNLPHRGPLDLFLQITNLSICAPLGMAYAFPLLLWFVLFRRALLEAWQGESAGHPGERSG